MFNVRMGDPTKAEDKARLMKQSPLNAADKIRTPLMVVQGQNDPRVKRAESDQIVIALRDRGFPVEYLVAPDEGHGFARPVNNMAMIASTEKFLAKHLGGRFQEEVPADVATRLKEITVDPKTVTLTAAPTAAAGAPKPVADLAPMKASYSASIAMGGQSIAMKIAQEAREENGAWVFTETAETPMGAADRFRRHREGHAAAQEAHRQAGTGRHRARVLRHRDHGHAGDERPVAAGERDARWAGVCRRTGLARGDRTPAAGRRATRRRSATSTSARRRSRSSSCRWSAGSR